MTEGRGGLGDRLISVLLHAYPTTFRTRFGEGMRYALLAEAGRARQAGMWSSLAFWANTVLSVAVRGLVERAHSEPLRAAARDTRLAARRLGRRPGFTLAAVATLALGIGGATAVFGVVNGVILSPLPYPEGDRLVRVGHRSSSQLGVPDAGYFYYRETSRTLSEFAVYYENSSTVVGTGAPLELGVVVATPSLLLLLGIEPMLGRLFTEADAAPAAAAVAVVTHGYWVRQLGADPTALGRDTYPGSGVQVVGVLPPEFRFVRPQPTFVFGNPFEEPDLFLPLGMERSTARFGNFMYQGIGRLAPGAAPADAQRELDVLMFEAAEAYPANADRGGYTPEGLRENGHRPEVTTVKDAIIGDVRDVLWIVMASVGIMLLIAAANVANLFLVRAESRGTELAIQRALGGGRGALARSFISEGLVVAVLGGALGLAFASGGTKALLLLAPSDLPRLSEVGMHLPVVAFAAAVSVLSGIVLGWVPLGRLSRLGIAGTLSESGRSGSRSLSRRRTQHGLIVGQVGLALVLLVGSALLLRTVDALRSVDAGFDPRDVLTVEVSLGTNIVRGAGFSDAAIDASRSRFMLDLVRELETVPGVEQAAFAGDLPLDEVAFRDHIAVAQRFPEEEITLRSFIGPGYFEAINARLVAGRELEASEFADQVRSVVVNQMFAQRWWPGQEAIGQRLLQYWTGVDPDLDVWYTVVGVVADLRETSLMELPEPAIYLPTMMLPEGGFGIPISNFTAVLRTSGDPLAVAPAVRQAIRERYPELPINDVSTLRQRTAGSFAQVSFAMTLLIIAGVTSALLGIVGVYGTVAYVVRCRTKEFGLRIALGASSWKVERGVLSRAAGLGAVGVAIGLVAARVASRLLESLLFEVAPTDPAVYGSVGAGLFALVVLAALPPALRAAAADPMDALRAE